MYSLRLLRSVAPLKVGGISQTVKTMSSSTSTTSPLISGSKALALHEAGKAKFLDGSWHLDKARNPLAEFSAERIPGSQYFDIETIKDLQSPLPHMLPTAEAFSEYVSALGVSSNDHVIIYTKSESFSAARAWWMFHVFGHKNVSILDGGVAAWEYAGGKMDTTPPGTPTKGEFNATFNPKLVVGWEDVLKVVNDGSAQILDARSEARFLALAPEPRPGLPSGHIPGSLSLPFTKLVKRGDVTTFTSKEEIRDAFVNTGVIFGSKTILSCGSGVSAAVLALSLNLIGKDLESCPIYDGSWTEWASRPDLPRMPEE